MFKFNWTLSSSRPVPKKSRWAVFFRATGMMKTPGWNILHRMMLCTASAVACFWMTISTSRYMEVWRCKHVEAVHLERVEVVVELHRADEVMPAGHHVGELGKNKLQTLFLKVSQFLSCSFTTLWVISQTNTPFRWLLTDIGPQTL